MKKRTIVGYGLGQYFESVRERGLLKEKIEFDYYCDRKWEEEPITEYKGVPVISKEKIIGLDSPLVVVLLKNQWTIEAIINEFSGMGIECVSIRDIIPLEYGISGATLKEKYSEGLYQDDMGNTVRFDETIPDKLYIVFGGMNNKLVVGRNISTALLVIRFGNEGICTLGSNSELIGAELYISYGEIKIGDNCLFSNQIILRNHDGHHIFDKTSGKRINYCKDIIIGNHVWIGQRAMVLGGACVGSNSVVGTGSVVTKPCGENVVIAGVPARVVRENICWNTENTDYFNRDYLDECIDWEVGQIQEMME